MAVSAGDALNVPTPAPTEVTLGLASRSGKLTSRGNVLFNVTDGMPVETFPLIP